VLWIALPVLWTALGGWREPLLVADATGDVALRDRTIAALTARLGGPHVEPANRLLYWIAYANFRQSAAVAAQMAAAPTRDAALRLTLVASRYHYAATLLTRRFGLDDPREWRDEAHALGAPWEFISPYLAAPQPAASHEAGWRERIWLARIDPSQVDDIEARFARERPDEDFNTAWVQTFDEGVSLPESTVTTLGGDAVDLRRDVVNGWTAMLAWTPDCEACRDDLLRFDALGRAFPVHALLLAIDQDVERVRLSLADRGITLPTIVAPTALVRELRVSAGSRILVSPDRVFVPLRGVRWEDDVRRAFSLAPR